MTKDADIINFDTQGWPEYKENLKEILEYLGANIYKTEDGQEIIGFNTDNAILNAYPRTLIDDGMGYGVDEKCIVSTDVIDNKFINFFIEKSLPTDELKKELDFIGIKIEE